MEVTEHLQGAGLSRFAPGGETASNAAPFRKVAKQEPRHLRQTMGSLEVNERTSLVLSVVFPRYFSAVLLIKF